MNDNRPAYFDLETVALLREVLEAAWALLRPEQCATMLKTTLAERILKVGRSGREETASDCSTLRYWSSRPKRLEFTRPRESARRKRSGRPPMGVACSHRSCPRIVSLRGRRASGHLLRPRSWAALATEAPLLPDPHSVLSGEQCAHPEIRAHRGAASVRSYSLVGRLPSYGLAFPPSTR